MKFFHHIPRTGKGGATFAYQFKDNKVMFSVAQCSEKERYCKKKGRDVATEKFLAGEMLSLAVKGSKKKQEEKVIHLFGILGSSTTALRVPYALAY